MRIHHAAAVAAVLTLLAACEKSEPPEVIIMDVPGAAPVGTPPVAPAETPVVATPASPETPPATPAAPAATPPPKAAAPAAAPPAKGATAAAVPAAKTAASAAPAVKTAPPADPAADLANGQTQFARCQVCHAISPGAPASLGPNLAGVVGRRAASADYANYSDAMKSSGITWTEANLDRYLTRPAALVPGTRMTFPGLPDQKSRADLIAWLKTK